MQTKASHESRADASRQAAQLGQPPAVLTIAVRRQIPLHLSPDGLTIGQQVDNHIADAMADGCQLDAISVKFPSRAD